MDSSNRFGQGWRDKIRGGRLVTSFHDPWQHFPPAFWPVSMLTGHVSAKQAAVDSSDAKPLQIPNPVTLSNGFSAIAKQVGPAVVNINTEILPKETALPDSRRPDGAQSARAESREAARATRACRTSSTTSSVGSLAAVGRRRRPKPGAGFGLHR